jgi:hypothetical protein
MDKKEALRQKAVEAGCKPFWWDGIFGWAWHCGCDDLAHACDSQCSMITEKSLLAAADGARPQA